MEKPDFTQPNLTVGQMYGPAMKITEPADAQAYFDQLVAYLQSHEKTREEAEALARSNLGYFSGYYDLETMQRVGQLYGK
jgi:hypothetical protein